MFTPLEVITLVEIVYYVAASVDGYIATTDGGVDWLPTPDENNDYGYNDFYTSVDALIMGRRTYEKALDFGEWFYPDKSCWVMSQQQIQIEQPNVALTASSPAEMVETLEANQFKRVWLVGGGELAASFRAQGLISEYVIAVIPMLLGEGIPLFAAIPAPHEKLNLIECKSLPGDAVSLTYRRDRPNSP